MFVRFEPTGWRGLGYVSALSVALVAGCSRTAEQAKPSDREPAESKPSDNAPKARGVAGTWQSDWGPVTIEHGPLGGDKSVTVTGSWIEGEGKRGVITGGNYDPRNGKLDVLIEEPWIRQRGAARFQLSEDGKALRGTWELNDGEKGDWTLLRKSEK
jgi:hypothetical protein